MCIKDKFKSLVLYEEKQYGAFIVAAEDDVIIAKGKELGRLYYYLANANIKIGHHDHALINYRRVFDIENVEKSVLCACCLNMAIIASYMKDFDFAKECVTEYLIYKGESDNTHRCLMYLIGNNWHSKKEFDKFVEDYLGIEDAQERGVVQLILSLKSLANSNVKFAVDFVDRVYGKHVINANLHSVVFEYATIVGDLDKMKSIVSDMENGKITAESMVILDYMRLRIRCINGESGTEVCLLAKSVAERISINTTLNSRSILSLCGTVLRANEKYNRILVPSRFGIIGISPVVSALRDRIDRYARSSSPVLIQGQSGTGKELAAQALHDAGDRAAAPFIPVNCAAIPESVFESQLFGHVAGAFTGAGKDQPGLIELAGEGTLFLDEVGELPQGVQAKLLRFLENGEYRRLGGERILKSRARIVAATNRGLGQESGFRQDLYHRLRRLELQMPALRDRREDIRYLARHRIRQLNLQDGSGWKQLDDEAEQVLEGLDYAGNVRELFNLVDHAWHEAVQQISPAEVERARHRLAAELRERETRMATSTDGQELDVRFAAGENWTLDFAAPSAPLRHIQERAACEAIRQALAHYDGDVERAARFLDVSRRSIYRYLERERLDA